MDSNEKTPRNWVKPAVIVGGIIAIPVLLRTLVALGIGDYWYSEIGRALRGGYPAFKVVGALVLITIVITAMVFGYREASKLANVRYNSYHRTAEDEAAQAAQRKQARSIRTKTSVIGGVALVVATLLLVVGIRQANRSEYDAVRMYSANLTVENADRPSFDARINIATAKVLLAQSIPSGGHLNESTIANVGNDVCGLVERDSVWYQGTSTTGVVCLSNKDSNERKFVEFEAKLPSAEGSMGKNLNADITEQHGLGLSFGNADVYGYIGNDGKPNMVVPVVRKVGFDAPHDVVAGVVVYDTNGHSKMLTDVNPGDIPGPVLPASVAASVRYSVNTLDGFVKYDKPGRNTNALQETGSKGAETVPDPNAGNNTEFVLMSGGRMYYVTMLTSYGSSSAVVATLVVEADTVHAGQMPEAVLYRHGDQSGTKDVAQRITSLYANLQWAQSNDATATDGNLRRIYEVTPAGPDTVRATVGTGGQVQFYAIVKVATGAGDKVGEVCVYSAKTGGKVQCDGPTVDVTTLNLGDTANPGTGTGSETEVGNGFDVTKLSNDELVKLIEAASKELSNRAK